MSARPPFMGKSLDEDDPYAAFQIPDDLMW